MMDCVVLGEKEGDIECCGTTSEEDRTNDLASANQQTSNVLNRFWCGFLGFDGSENPSNCLADESMELLIDKNSEGEEGFLEEEKRKKKNYRKPPKPPRPPKGPLLDAADQKLVQEITQLAMRKRARMERIKALKKLRAAKASSWNSSLSAMVVTVLFCLVIIFHGICSRHSGGMFFQGSPEPATSEDVISVQLFRSFSAYEDGPGSGYPSSSLAEGQVPGSGFRKK